MRDIAELVGVSQTTVSHVLSGRGSKFRINVKTAERIEETARRLGYRPSALARGFKAQKAWSIALAVGDLTNPFWTGVALGAQREAEKEGYILAVFNTDETVQKETRVVEMLRERRVDAAILSPTGLDEKHLVDLRKEGLPFVLVDRYVEGLDASTVQTDSSAGTELAVDHLVRRGHRKIAYLGGPPHISTFRDRAAGFRQALQRRGLSPGPYADVDGSIDSARRAMPKLLREKPTALFAANLWLLLGSLHAATNGIEFAGFDDFFVADLLRTPVTTVAQPMDEMGRTAVRLLLEEMRGHARPRRVLLPPKLIVRT